MAASEAMLDRPIRALIVDDEEPGRALLRHLLATEAGFEIAAECGDGAAALAEIERLRPDLVLLDIAMPVIDGIAAAARVDMDGPVVVFVTAHDEHALAAFEARGFDYVLKPVAKKRFKTALERVRAEVRKRRIAAGDRADAQRLDRIRLRVGPAIKYVAVEDVMWFEGASQYVNVHARQGTFLVSSETLAGLEAKLDPRRFFRVHRSAIVNKAHVERGVTNGDGAVFLTLTSGCKLRVSRKHKHRLRDLLLLKQDG